MTTPVSPTGELWIGLMSGTSLDGVDAVLVRIQENDTGEPGGIQTLGHVHQAFNAELRQDLLALNTRGSDDLHRAMLAANGVARAYAGAVNALLEPTGLSATDVQALGAHGQTVRHQPGVMDGVGYTVQLLNAALLAELTGIDVVHDLRSRDLAAGGQGAPLVPAFHATLFGEEDTTQVVVNVGGMANLTLLPAQRSGQPVNGWDTGPGNVLMDGWIQRHRGLSYDADGQWAASGKPIPHLLAKLKTAAQGFFDQPPPKSTGRERFDLEALDRAMAASAAPSGAASGEAADVQATLCDLTAWSIAQEVRRALDLLAASGASDPLKQVLVCGGGAFNGHLMSRLRDHLIACGISAPVISTAHEGLPPDQIEALAFAWLAWCFVRGRPGNLPAVTGAAGLRRLGSWTPAR